MRPWKFVQKKVGKSDRDNASEEASEDDPEDERHTFVMITGSLHEREDTVYCPKDKHPDMGMRKKGRNKWKADRKVDEAKRRRAKAIRLTKTAAT